MPAPSPPTPASATPTRCTGAIVIDGACPLISPARSSATCRRSEPAA